MPIIPLSEIPEATLKAMREQAIAKMRAFAVKNLDAPEREIIIREAWCGDADAATDFVDFDWRTDVVAGGQFWGQDAADLTPNDLSSWMKADSKVPDDACWGIYGFLDLTPSPDLTAISLKKGAEVKDLWQVEHCYGEAPYGGISVGRNGEVRLATWGHDDPIDIQMCFKTSADKAVVLFALVGERLGKRITVPQ